MGQLKTMVTPGLLPGHQTGKGFPSLCGSSASCLRNRCRRWLSTTSAASTIFSTSICFMVMRTSEQFST